MWTSGTLGYLLGETAGLNMLAVEFEFHRFDQDPTATPWSINGLGREMGFRLLAGVCTGLTAR